MLTGEQLATTEERIQCIKYVHTCDLIQAQGVDGVSRQLNGLKEEVLFII